MVADKRLPGKRDSQTIRAGGPEPYPEDRRGDAWEPRADAGRMMGAPLGEEGGCANVWPRPVLASQLRPDPTTDNWIMDGYIRPESITLLTARPKAGKTTWIAHLLACLAADGQFCGQDAKATHTLVVSEETQGQWADRVGRLAIGDHVHFLTRFLKKRLDFKEWSDFITHLARAVWKENLQLAIIDPLPNFWPVHDENNAAEVHAAMAPLRLFSELKAALLLVMHPRKSGGDDGTATRGSGAIAGFADILVDMRRMDGPFNAKDRRRVLTALSRFTETPSEIVVELTEDERSYLLLGDRHQAGKRQLAELLATVLPSQGDGDGLTSKQIQANWPAEPKPSLRTIEIAIKSEVEANRVIMAGAGTKNDPRRYWRRDIEQGYP